jgi:DNA modification methylase
MIRIIEGDCLTCLRALEPESVQCCVTSPPYLGLRDYGVEGQLGLEKTPEEYVAKMVAVFREVRRVLRVDGTVWLNLGDSYARNGGTIAGGNRELMHMEGTQRRMTSIPKNTWKLKEKDLVGIPWSVAFALQADGWYLRQDIIWHKPNPMPESVTDRCTKSHEYIFLLSKSARYYYDAEAVKEKACRPEEEGFFGRAKARAHITPQIHPNLRNGHEQLGRKHTNGATRNKRSVWTVATFPYSEAHFATFPPDLIKPCTLAGTKSGDLVLDPFAGSGTTGMVALDLGRKAILIELNPEYVKLIRHRCDVTFGLAL